ncbi:unnamed protein product [Linum tenue]|uniref:Uncharacterized protein n=1 Tax=Linum tenue TaxID=586396 RepID=A0AAV0JGS1_9ROSI|nr:unnamed protein product [Linum tenue]
MIANVDLITAALLHGAFIAAVLTAASFILLFALSLATFVALFSIPIVDLHDAVSFLSGHYLESVVQPNIHLASFLALYSSLGYAIELHSAAASTPLYRRLRRFVTSPAAPSVRRLVGIVQRIIM